MADQVLQILAFNRGLISQLALARVDLKRSAFSAETMDNWMARSLGSMMLRPGTGYKGATAGNAAAKYVPFVFRTDDTALIEFTNTAMRVWVNDALITRPTVTSAVTNGNFDANLNSWTQNDEVGAVSDWVTDGGAGGYMRLLGNGTAAAIRDQKITVPGASINIEHGLKIVIFRGPVTLRIGTTSGGTEIISDTTLRTGTHSIAFTPSTDFWIRFLSTLDRYVLVDSCNVEAAGVMSISSPYLTADLDNIRAGEQSQSGDIIFVACSGYQQRRIERHATRGWSLVLYQANDGPFGFDNATAITIASTAISGNVTLTASAALFKSTHVGALFQISSNGQLVTKSANAQNIFTDTIRVTGVGAGRLFSITITGYPAAGTTVTMQRSLVGTTEPWTDIKTWVANTTETYNDTLDNQIAWYRIGVKTGDYGAGTVVMTLTYTVGSIAGVARVTDFTNNTTVLAEILTHLGGTAAVSTWAEGEWSDLKGWPTAVSFMEARLGWAGKDTVWLSTTDAFDNFLDENPDGTPVGDSGPIDRTIGFGPVDIINWMLPLQRLILGGQGTEFSCRSSALDEPLTSTNFNIKGPSNQGSAAVNPVKIDNRGAFVQRGGTRLFELAVGNLGDYTYDYGASDLTTFIPEVGGPIGTTTHIVRLAVQRQPDTRIHCIRSDGVAAVLVYDKAENIMCWLTLSTTGLFEEVVVLPAQSGQREDQVYYVVNRTINGAVVRYLEKWALESECLGGTLTKIADAFVTFTNAPPNLIVSGLTHLIGATVICWHDGLCEEDANGDVRTYVVDGAGTITLTTLATTGVVGLAYDSQWKGSFLGQNLIPHKRISDVGLMLANTHPKGLRFGPTLTNADMDYLPLVNAGAPADINAIYSTYAPEPIPFPGGWAVDKRLCLKASAPRPVTVLAAVVSGEAHV